MSEVSEPLQFAIKGTTPSRSVVWLTACDSNGCRYFGPLSRAERFDHRSDAEKAVAALPRPLRDAGFYFWVMALPTEAMKKQLHERLAGRFGEELASQMMPDFES